MPGRCGVLTLGDRQADPSGCQHASALAVREQGDIAGEVVQAGNEVVCALADACGCFAARAAVIPDVPGRVQFVDLRSAQAFVVAVVPFGQFRLELDGCATEACVDAFPVPCQALRNGFAMWRQQAFHAPRALTDKDHAVSPCTTNSPEVSIFTAVSFGASLSRRPMLTTT